MPLSRKSVVPLCAESGSPRRDRSTDGYISTMRHAAGTLCLLSVDVPSIVPALLSSLHGGPRTVRVILRGSLVKLPPHTLDVGDLVACNSGG